MGSPRRGSSGNCCGASRERVNSHRPALGVYVRPLHPITRRQTSLQGLLGPFGTPAYLAKRLGFRFANNEIENACRRALKVSPGTADHIRMGPRFTISNSDKQPAGPKFVPITPSVTAEKPVAHSPSNLPDPNNGFVYNDGLLPVTDKTSFAIGRNTLSERIGAANLGNSGIVHQVFETPGAKARLVAFVNKRWQTHHREDTGFIGHVSTSDHNDLGQLVTAAEQWLRARGCSRVVVGCNGSYPFSAGIQVDNHTKLPPFPVEPASGFVRPVFERMGYVPARIDQMFRVSFNNPYLLQQMAQLRYVQEGIAVRCAASRKWEKELEVILPLAEACGHESRLWYPQTSTELAQSLGSFAATLAAWQLVYVVHNDAPVGVALATFNYNPALQATDHRVGVLANRKFSNLAMDATECCVHALLVHPDMRGRGLGTLMVAQLIQNFSTYSDVTSLWLPPLPANTLVTKAFATKLGGVPYFQTALFERSLFHGN